MRKWLTNSQEVADEIHTIEGTNEKGMSPAIQKEVRTFSKLTLAQQRGEEEHPKVLGVS